MKYFTSSELGDFQVVVKPILIYLIMLFVFPIFRFLLPELSFLIAKRDLDEIFKMKRYIYIYSFIVSFSFIALSFLYSQTIITTLFSSEYVASYLMIEHLSIFFIFIILNGYQIAFIKASGCFLEALIIRLCGVVAFVITFFVIKLFSENIISVIIALDSAYLCMFLVSFFIERRELNRLKGLI
jgi:O-antigen/teichoic acid export membrane protein